ncbi:MAG: helix-turn-helix domain-containing protein [Desulfobulbus sp.]
MIGSRLKLLRKRKKLTQKELAECLETSQSYVSSLEQDKQVPGGEILVSLKRFFSVSIDWLLTGENDQRALLSDGKEIDSAKKSEKRKFAVLDQAENWLTEEVKKNPKREIWFEVEFEKAFQEFKEWREEKSVISNENTEFKKQVNGGEWK